MTLALQNDTPIGERLPGVYPSVLDPGVRPWGLIWVSVPCVQPMSQALRSSIHFHRTPTIRSATADAASAVSVAGMIMLIDNVAPLFLALLDSVWLSPSPGHTRQDYLAPSAAGFCIHHVAATIWR